MHCALAEQNVDTTIRKEQKNPVKQVIAFGPKRANAVFIISLFFSESLPLPVLNSDKENRIPRMITGATRPRRFVEERTVKLSIGIFLSSGTF